MSRALTLQQKLTLSIIAKGNKRNALADGPWYENHHTCPGKPKQMDACAQRLAKRGLITRTTGERNNWQKTGSTREHYAIYQITSAWRDALSASGW